MNEQVAKFRLGVFVLGALILLAILIILFGDAPQIFSRPYEYTVTFTHAPGVDRGVPVRKSGIKIGEVKDFELNGDTGEVAITIVVERKYQLRQEDQAYLTRGLVLGETAINFVPVRDEERKTTPAPSGHVFTGVPPADLTQALGKATGLAELTTETLQEIRDAAKEIKKVAPSIDKFVARLGPTNEAAQKTLDDITATSKAIREFVPELDKTNKEARAAIRELAKAAESVDVLVRGNQEKIAKIIDQLGDINGRLINVLSEENQKNLNATLKNLKNASDGFEPLIQDARALAKRLGESLDKADAVMKDIQAVTKPLAEKAPVILKNVEEASAKFNQVGSNVAEFAKMLVQSDGTLKKFIVDPALYNALNDAASGLGKSMPRIDKVLRDIEVFADKIARHPELLGIRGAVAPGSGVKPP